MSNLPPSASWQDLKDHFRQAGDVIFTDVDRRGGGVVEFASRSDQETAISKLVLPLSAPLPRLLIIFVRDLCRTSLCRSCSIPTARSLATPQQTSLNGCGGNLKGLLSNRTTLSSRTRSTRRTSASSARATRAARARAPNPARAAAAAVARGRSPAGVFSPAPVHATIPSVARARYTSKPMIHHLSMIGQKGFSKGPFM